MRTVMSTRGPGLGGQNPMRSTVAPHTIFIRVVGNVLSVSSPVAGARRTVAAISGADGELGLIFRDDAGNEQVARARFERDGRLTLESHDGPWRGTAVLSR